MLARWRFTANQDVAYGLVVNQNTSSKHQFENPSKRTIYPDNSQVGCPEDEFAPHEPWPANWATGEDVSKTINDRTILLDHDITLHKLRIAGTGKLIVKGRFSLKAFHSTFREFLCRLFTIHLWTTKKFIRLKTFKRLWP